MTDDERAIRDLVDKWMTASKNGDTATVLDLMTDDVIFMVPGQAPFGKDAFANASKQMNDMKIDGTAEIIELRVLNDWAFIRNRIQMTVTPSGGPSTRRSGYTLTLLRKGDDGRWRLTRDANLVTAEN